MGEIVGEFIKGVKEAQAAIDAMERRVDMATLRGVKKAQTIAKRYVKKEIRGAPRWSQRGPIGRDGSVPGVDLGAPRHRPRGGGPGVLTGHLRGAVGGMKRPKRTGPATYEGGVGAGGPSSITNLYRKHVDQKYPYMRPGVDKAEAEMGAAYKEVWTTATRT